GIEVVPAAADVERQPVELPLVLRVRAALEADFLRVRRRPVIHINITWHAVYHTASSYVAVVRVGLNRVATSILVATLEAVRAGHVRDRCLRHQQPLLVRIAAVVVLVDPACSEIPEGDRGRGVGRLE